MRLCILCSTKCLLDRDLQRHSRNVNRSGAPQVPSDLAALDGTAMRSTRTGRIRQWAMRDVSGAEMNAPLKETFVVNDPAAMRTAAVLGLGVTLIAVPDVLLRARKWRARTAAPTKPCKPAPGAGSGGRGSRIRTCDPLLPKQMRYQTAPCPDGTRMLTASRQAATTRCIFRSKRLSGRENNGGQARRPAVDPWASAPVLSNQERDL